MSLQSLILTCLGERDALSLGQEQVATWESWLTPIDAVSPMGEAPGYDDDFQRMRDEVNKLSGADAGQVIDLAQKLFSQRCKDLRVATYYLWARLHKDGEAGLADGLSLLAALIERYAAEVLPARPNSRKLALEWLAGSKVLDSLSLYPEVVKSEAERTVAALAWLEHGLGAWPPEQRPVLDALYGALSTRLAQSGGVDAVVPQNSASHESNIQAGAPSAPALKSGRDLLDSGRALAAYLREQPQGWLAAHRLMKSLRWDTVHQTPSQEVDSNTRLAAPRADYRAQLKRLHLQRRWSELLELVERVYAEGVNHFWLDLQWYLYQALSKQPAPWDGWADIAKRDLGMFLERLPGLETLCWSDGTPLADETTREWLSQQVSGNRPQQWLPAPAAVSTATDTEWLSLEEEALAQADSDGVEAALAWLAARPDVQSGRRRWLLRLLMARLAEQYGKSDLALHLLGELEGIAGRQALVEWEPELVFEINARLLKLLRLKAQRNDTDKTTMARRMEALLAALVAIDPVRAAVLCG
ncbi:type VI secretion system protein TssA [Pseudomonas gingeri]|uniref:type VI secretion system protein TssA n=1 Tax=Pseudomonas gingeri TaxID=117681 RepID=UPI0015A39B5F|nr:type VI secretion system protein TssA [Pseudomonas gingeri]NWA02762.1 type VI secretion system protein TssA [Pseudomonas gingeri]NWA12064.1 type VI secretion system protein TssA [Pseudomonas gingeri]NWA57529.1 type VI secretion system protein TssA [Pseudomonas gingeri]NWA93872.1 type VI secretion system protein TssA [Pseudomonas gingeri]NWB03344.1 type VI secretion system protein TssA [Pseudomonas gingeri]